MERHRERLMREGTYADTPLGIAKAPSLSVPLPRPHPPIPRRKPSEAQIPLAQTLLPTPNTPATVRTDRINTLPAEQPEAGPSSRSGHSAANAKFPLPRVTAKDWSAKDLCEKYRSFEHVRRVSALSDPQVLSKALDDYEQDGIPLVIEDWHKHHSWPRDIFNLEWLLQTSGDKQINVRNMHDRSDRSMTLAEFVSISRAQSVHSIPGETQRLYWKDADCPHEWREWLEKSSNIPLRVLPASPDDYLGYLPHDEAVESLLCYMGIGDTYTAAHKDLCSSSGHNLMCFSENDGTSFWFMTAANDAPAVAKYFHNSLGQELDWETHVTTLEELGKAPFTVYIAQQKVGDLVLVPPRSCHQVVNAGGLAMKTSWSRMTLDNLRTALHCELPIYRRVCRPEQYRVKTVLYRSVLHLTEALQAALDVRRTPMPEPQSPKDELDEIDDIHDERIDVSSWNAIADYPDSPAPKSTRNPTPALPRAPTPTPAPATSTPPDVRERAQKLKRLVQLFDEVLRDEFAACHAKLEHVLRSETSAGWGMTAASTPSDDKDKVGDSTQRQTSDGFKFTLQPPADSRDRRNSDPTKYRASCHLACDFCGADIFQSFFECKRCRTSEDGSTPQPGDGLLLCPGCFVEGRICKCGHMEPMQCRPFDTLLSDRNDAAKVIARALSPEEAPVEARDPRELWARSDVCIFEAACALRKYRVQRTEEARQDKIQCRLTASKETHYTSPAKLLRCGICHTSRCFRHLLAMGTHAAEGIMRHLKYNKGGGHDWHAYHVKNTAAVKRGDFKEKLFDLDRPTTVNERLLIAATSFPKCRPGHEKVRLGYYDRESGAEDLSFHEPEARPTTPVMPDADSTQIAQELSPLTPVNSSSDDGSLFGSPVLQGREEPSAVPPPLTLSRSSTADDEREVGGEVNPHEVIEIEYSDSTSSRAAVNEDGSCVIVVPDSPCAVDPDSLGAVADPDGERAIGDSDSPRVPAATERPFYIEVPRLPGYAARRKRASSPFEEDPATRSRKKPKQRDPEDAVSIRAPRGADDRATHSSSHRRHSPMRKHARRSSDSCVADNTSIVALQEALNRANGAPESFSQTPRPVKRQRAPKRPIPVVRSDSEHTPSPPPESVSTEVLALDMTLAYPETEGSARASLAGSVAPPSAHEAALATASGPSPLPRPATLKRTHTDAILEPDRPSSAPMTNRNTKASLAALGPIQKKRKGPPGIPEEEMAKKREAEREEDIPKARAGLKSKVGVDTSRRRVSRASDSRSFVANSSLGPAKASSVQNANRRGAAGDSMQGSLTAYLLPNPDELQTSAQVCAALASQSEMEVSGHAQAVADPPQLDALRSHSQPLVASTSASALSMPTVSPAPPSLPNARPPRLLEAAPLPEDAYSQINQACHTLAVQLPLVMSQQRIHDQRLEVAITTLQDGYSAQERKLKRLGDDVERLNDVVSQRDRTCERLKEDLEAKTTELQTVKGELAAVKDAQRKEREEKGHLVKTIRTLEEKLGSMEAVVLTIRQAQERIEGASQIQLQGGQPGPQQHPPMHQPNPYQNPNFGGHNTDMPPQQNIAWRQQQQNFRGAHNGGYNPQHNNGGYRGHNGNNHTRFNNQHGPGRQYWQENNHGPDRAPQVNNWDRGDRSAERHENPPQHYPSQSAGPRDTPYDRRQDRDGPSYTPDRRHTRSPTQRPSADESPVSEFSEHGRRQERTPPSTIESYPSPCEPGRSHSSIQDSSFTDHGAAPPPATGHSNRAFARAGEGLRQPAAPSRTREGSAAYPSPKQDFRPHHQDGERRSRGSSRTRDDDRYSRASSRPVDGGRTSRGSNRAEDTRRPSGEGSWRSGSR